MDGPTTVDPQYLDWLSSATVTLGRPTSTTSLVVDHEGRRCLVAFTATEPMARWWRERSHKSLRTITIPVSDLAARWGAPEVDLLVDPGTPQETYVPIGDLRARLGLGPVAADGDGHEPLAFAGFTGGTYMATRSLTLVVTAVAATVFGLVIGSLPLAGAGLVFLALALLLARSTFREVRSAARARRSGGRSEATTAQAAPAASPPEPRQPPSRAPAPPRPAATWPPPAAPGAPPGPVLPAPQRTDPRSRRPWLVVAGAVALVAVAVGAAVFVSRPDGDGTERDGRDPGWSSDLAAGTYEVVVEGDLACGTTTGGSLYCLDPETGAERFSTDIGDVPGAAVPVEDTLIVTSQDSSGTGRLSAFTLDGDELWTAEGVGNPQPGERPAVARGVVAGISGSATSRVLVGVAADTGERRWETLAGRDRPVLIEGPVHTDGDRFYVGLQDMDSGRGYVIAVEAASGDELWRSEVTDGIPVTVALEQATVLDGGAAVAFIVNAGIQGREVLALDADTGQRRWSHPLSGDHVELGRAGDVTVVADHGQLRGYDADGAVLWTAPEPNVERHPDLFPGNLVVAGDTLYDAGYDLFTIDPETGTSRLVLGEAEADHVAVAGDRLLIAGTEPLLATPIREPER